MNATRKLFYLIQAKPYTSPHQTEKGKIAKWKTKHTDKNQYGGFFVYSGDKRESKSNECYFQVGASFTLIEHQIHH